MREHHHGIDPDKIDQTTENPDDLPDWLEQIDTTESTRENEVPVLIAIRGDKLTGRHEVWTNTEDLNMMHIVLEGALEAFEGLMAVQGTISLQTPAKDVSTVLDIIQHADKSEMAHIMTAAWDQMQVLGMVPSEEE